MERDGSFTHFAISAALTEREMATQERSAEELVRQRRLEYLKEVKAEVNKYEELTARVNDKLRTETEKFETKQLCLNSLQQVNEALVKEAMDLEWQLSKEKENSAAKQAELSMLQSSTDNLRRQINSVTKKMKKASGVWSMEKAVAALQEECEAKQASINAMDEEIRQIGAGRARDDVNQFIVKLAEVKVSTEATRRQIHEARAEVERLEAMKRALEEEERARSKNVAQVRALPQRHPTEGPQTKPCAASSGKQLFHTETSAIPSTAKQGSANQPAKQSKDLPSRNVAPSKLPGSQLSLQLSTSSIQPSEPSRPPTSSAQTPEPPRPTTSSAQTPEPNRPSARSTRLGLSEYFDNLRMKLPTAPSPKLSADKRPGLAISKPFFPPPPSKQQRMKGTTTTVPITPSATASRPVILPPAAPGDKSAAASAPTTSRPSLSSRQPTFFPAPESATPQPPQEGASRIDSAKVHQGLDATTQPAPLLLAPPRPVRMHTSPICRDARPGAPPRSFLASFRAENSTSSRSAAPRPQGESDPGSLVSKQSSGEKPRGQDAATPPTTPAPTPSRPIHQHTITTHRDSSQPPQSPCPPKYRAQTFAAPQSTAPQPQGTSHADLPVGRFPSTEAPRARTATTEPTTLGTASSTHRDIGPQAETFAARQGQASDTQNSGPHISMPVSERVRTNTAQGGERPDPFSPPPRRIPLPSLPVLPFQPPQRGRPAAAQGAQPPSDQRALEHGWPPALAPATQAQPAQPPTTSSQWSSPPPTQASDMDQSTRPLRGSPTHSEFSFGASAQSPGGGGEDAFNLFGEDDDEGAGGSFQFSLAGAGSNPPRFNF